MNEVGAQLQICNLVYEALTLQSTENRNREMKYGGLHEGKKLRTSTESKSETSPATTPIMGLLERREQQGEK